MAIVNGPQFPNVTLGRPTKIGTVTTNTDGLQFSFSSASQTHSGAMLIQAVGNGTVTTLTADLRMTLDQVVADAVIQTPVGGFTGASTTSALALGGGNGALIVVGVPGTGGQMTFVLQVTALTLGTATSVAIFVHLN